MPRNISFALTTEPFKNRTKTVSRRLGWWEDKKRRRIIRAGDLLMGCEKCQGIEKGGLVRLGLIQVVDVRREPLNLMLYPDYGSDEVVKEGFPNLTGGEFVDMFCSHMNCNQHEDVTRIAFRYVDEE